MRIRDREQKADQKLGGEPVVFERLAGDLGIGPEKAAHVGHQPEPVDAERDQEQRRALDPELPIGRFCADEAHQAGKWRRAPSRGERWRRRCRKRRRIKGGGVSHETWLRVWPNSASVADAIPGSRCGR
jgi:hypothetical protein